MDGLVSRRHCEIHWDGETVRLLDLGSRNATLVNGRPVQECELQVGDEISVGRARLALVPLAAESLGPVREPGSTVSLHTTRAIFLSQDKEAWVGAERRQTINDLADLFSLNRSFWDVLTSRELCDAFAGWLRKRYGPSYLWLFESDEAISSGRPIYVEGDRIDMKWNQIGSAVRATLVRDEGMCRPLSVRRDRHVVVETLLCAPMRLHREVTGGVVLISSPSSAAYDEGDLQLLMAAANTAAPWFHVVDKVERLSFDNAQLMRAKSSKVSLVGESAALKQVRRAIQQSAKTDLTVLIQGETGTGKELAARMVHDFSARSEQPFIAINCASIPCDLLESELFGHERGAFSGAAARKRGLIELADTGTLFLDEIGDLRPEHQASLLRVLEYGTFRRVGGSEELSVSVRIVAATNRDLAAMVRDGSFREDLYFRLNGYAIEIPPLRDRPSDIVPLAGYFLDQVAKRAGTRTPTFSDEALEELSRRRWSGNVRELKQLVERAAVLAEGDRIQPADFLGTPAATNAAEGLTLQEVERHHILSVLERCNGRIADAARVLGIGRTTLYDKLSKYEKEKEPRDERIV